mgnify:CR=1 FL=1
MQTWIFPACLTIVLWGFWGFLPKITTRYIQPSSAIVYEVLGGALIAAIALFFLKVQPEFHVKGTILAVITGILGFAGAFCFLVAVSRGPVSLVATVSALYPVISIILAMMILKEPLSTQQAIGMGFALLSILLITA